MSMAATKPAAMPTMSELMRKSGFLLRLTRMMTRMTSVPRKRLGTLPKVPSALAAKPPARSTAPTRIRETPIIMTVIPATVGVMIRRRKGMIRLPAMTTKPPTKQTPKSVDRACSHGIPCSFMSSVPTAMRVPGKAKLVA